MPDYLEVWRPEGLRLVTLDKDRMTVGKLDDNDIPIPEDGQISRQHAMLERLAAGWVLRDLGSRNGTFINGSKVWSDRSLRPGDEIKVGQTRLVFRDAESGGGATFTEAAETPPDLTDDERGVLISMCRPVLGGDVFTEPASVPEIAMELGLAEDDVAARVDDLCAKFGVFEQDDKRLPRLANEAVRRGAVGLTDLR